MTILVDWQLKELCNQGLIVPYDEALVNPSSIDIRLGDEILEESIDGGFQRYQLSKHTAQNPYYLEPGEFVLACTLEYFKIPHNHTTWLALKSSRAREGLSHALAGWVENGFTGCLTLEIHNITQFQKIPIYAGLKIGQLIVCRTEMCTRGYSGKYKEFNTVVGAL